MVAGFKKLIIWQSWFTTRATLRTNAVAKCKMISSRIGTVCLHSPGQPDNVNYSNIPVKFAKDYKTIWIQLFQQFISIYSKSNVTTCHKKCYTQNTVAKVHDLI